MIAEKADEAIDKAVAYELQNIVKNHGVLYASEHEAYAVLLEEVQEACEASRFMAARMESTWCAIRNNVLNKQSYHIEEVKKFAVQTAQEAVQCAAVCERFLETIKKEEEHEKLS